MHPYRQLPHELLEIESRGEVSWDLNFLMTY